MRYLTDRDAIVADTETRLRAGQASADTDYIRLAEAIRLLGTLPDASQLRLASDSRLGIEFALNMPRVAGFPAWIRAGSPEWQADPLRNVDLVLLDTTGQSRYTSQLQSFMSDFILCLESPLWPLYASPTADPGLCR